MPANGTPHYVHCPAGKSISKEQFDILNYEIDLSSLLSSNVEYRLVHQCVKHNVSRAVMNKLFKNPMMTTVSHFTFSHTLFKLLNEMFYIIRINY